MAEGSGLNRTQVLIAVITVVGSLLTAVIVNADKWVARGEKAAVTAPAAAATPAQPGPAAPTPTTPTADIRNEQPAATASPTTEVVPRPVPTAPPSAAATIAVAGEWRDDDGSRFSFTQTGAHYEYTHTASNGTFQSIGKGTISGRDLSHSFEAATGETGSCSGRVNVGATKMTGNCLNADGGWTFVLER